MTRSNSSLEGIELSAQIRGVSPAAWLLRFLTKMLGLWAAVGLMVGALIAGGILVVALTPPIYPTFGVSYIDKVYHFIAFAVLIFPIILTEPRRWFWAIPACVAFGGMIELIQPSFGRTAEWLDFGADVSGVLAGAVLAELLHDRIRAWAARVRGDRIVQDDGLDDAARRERLRAELRAEMRAALNKELAASAQPHITRSAGHASKSGDPKKQRDWSHLAAFSVSGRDSKNRQPTRH